MSDQQQQLEEIAEGYDPSDPSKSFDYWFKRMEARAALPWLDGRSVLELGGATGELSDLLSAHAERYTVVEGSRRNCEVLERRLPNIDVIEGMWESYEPDETFTDVVLFEALEHYPEPVDLLRRCAGWLEPGGSILISVPNGRSLHRQVAVKMGMLPDPTALNDSDRAQGHLRNYDMTTLRRDVEAGGLEVVHEQGLFLKIVPNAMMMEWPGELVLAIDEVARDYGELGAELFMVARRPEPHDASR